MLTAPVKSLSTWNQTSEATAQVVVAAVYRVHRAVATSRREPAIIPPGVVTQELRTPGTIGRGVIAGVVGNILEWYDFALFGFFAQQIGAHFFPASKPNGLAPAVCLAIAGGCRSSGAILLPKALRHRLTTEFQTVRSRAAQTPAS